MLATIDPSQATVIEESNLELNSIRSPTHRNDYPFYKRKET